MIIKKLCQLCQKTGLKSIHSFRKYNVTSVCQDRYILPLDNDEISDIEQQQTEIINNNNNNPIIKCKRNSFDFYPGTEYSKYEIVPIASDGWNNLKSRGDFFTIFPVIENIDDEENEKFENVTFKDLGLTSKLIDIIKTLGYNEPTMIQKYGIPEILEGQNTVIQAETGTGKTHTYLLPIVDQIQRWKKLVEPKKNSPFVLILAPSRELVLQIGTEAKKLTDNLDINVKTLIGGRTKYLMRNPPLNYVDILIGTVGITSKLTTTRVYKLDEVRHTVLDEAHALFDETYEEKLSHFIKRINFGFKQTTSGKKAPTSSQLTMASATMPPILPEYLHNVIDMESLVPIQTKNIHRVLVPQKFMRLGPQQKPAALLKIMKRRLSKRESTLIFCNDTATCDWMSIFLNNMNINAISLHGNMPTPIRRDQYWKFRNGEVNVICTTNSTARGLDTVTVDCVINYDFPLNTADYIHRCGRTGRIGSRHPGRVINFISRPLEIDLTKKIERATRRNKTLPVFDLQEQYDEKSEKAADKELNQLLSLSSSR